MRKMKYVFLAALLAVTPLAYATVPTVSWNESSPAGSDARSQGDDRIREMKTQIREVVGVDHDFPSSGQATDVGQHLQITLQEQADLGTGAVNATILGSQTVSGKGELVYTDEDDNDVQITSGGEINLPGIVMPSGALFFMVTGSCPTGSTDVTATYSGKFVRANATGGSTGGADTHTHTAGSYAGPSHAHAQNMGASIPGGSSGNAVGASSGSGATINYNPSGSGNAVQTGVAAGGTGSVTGTSASSDNVPAYVTAKFCQVD